MDWTGFLTLSIFIASFQFMLDRGERLGDWFDSTFILLCASIAGMALYMFIAHSLTADRPFLDPKLLLDRNYALGLLLVFIFGMLNFTPTTLLPTLLQEAYAGILTPSSAMSWARSEEFRNAPRLPLDVLGEQMGKTARDAGVRVRHSRVSGWYMLQFNINMTCSTCCGQRSSTRALVSA